MEALMKFLGVQDPESRKARKMKHKEAESDYSNDLVNPDDDDDDSSKRQSQ